MKNLINLLLISLLLVTFISCSSDDEEKPVEKEFGKIGSHQVETFTANNTDLVTVYYPNDIASMSIKSPLIFFTSGWGSEPFKSTKYDALLRFLASHGHTVIYTDEGQTTDPNIAINRLETMILNQENSFKNNILPYIDFDKLGVIGHSAGGGTTLTTLKHFSDYGNKGRFIMELDPWYAFNMSENDIKTIPDNTNFVMLKFGQGGNSIEDGTDARIPLTIYSLLESIPLKNKDYQVYDDESANHHYPYGEIDKIQGILKPLDALLDYTFIEQSERTRIAALENGNDDPYSNGNGIQVVLNEYEYPCDGASTIINYCKIVE